MSIRVVLADDHQVVRDGIKALLEGTEIVVVGEASNGQEAVDTTIDLQPDVLVMDIRMPERDGLHALPDVRKQCPDTKVLMLSTFDNPTYVARSVALGAADYIIKASDGEDLVEVIRAVHEGRTPTAKGLLGDVKALMAKRFDANDFEHPLTNREFQVLRHVAFGLSNREIGFSLNISVETVKEHVQNILRKANMTDRTQAAVWAVKAGMTSAAV